MPRKKIFSLLLWVKSVLIVAFLIFFVKASHIYASRNEGKVCCNGRCFFVELAITPQERSKGLMFRKSLAPDQAMLFVYEDEQSRSFWMKNTYIPLDIVWLDSQRKITGVSADARPCLDGDCVFYRSPGPVQYVLEVNSGIAQNCGLKPGAECVFDIR